jgi:site-specific DNA-methyltransferase (adenine-specific)
MGKEWDSSGIAFNVPLWKEMLRIAKPGAIMLVFGGTRTFHCLTYAIEDAGWEIRDCLMWLYGSGMPKSMNISKAIDKSKGAERKVIGRNPNSRENCDKSNTLYESGTVGKTDYITEPATDLAKLWNGWGTSLKPAWEPIIVVMKPLDGTFAHNAEKWGVVGLNIDGGRIGTEIQKPSTAPDFRDVGKKSIETCGINKLSFGQVTNAKRKEYIPTAIGRWPTNVILECICDEVIEGKEIDRQLIHTNPECPCYMLDQQSGTLKGGASRFFYCAKSPKSERDAGLEDMPEQIKVWNGQSDKSSKDIKDVEQRFTTKIKNIHPTVKPLKLMEYLCKLTSTPTGGLILDPFCGSGSTCIAAKRLGRPFIGIDKEKIYCEISCKRLNAVV